MKNQGHSDDSIKEYLVSNGYGEQDIYKALQDSNKSSSNKKPIFIIIAGIAVIVVLVLLFFIFYDGNKESVDEINSLNVENNELNNVASNCAEDLDCFLKAVEKCDISKVEHNTETPILTVSLKATMNYEIKGKEGDNCIFYLNYSNAEYTSDMSNLPEGMDEAEAQAQLDSMNKVIDEHFEGKDGTCIISPTELRGILSRWKQGMYSTEDFPLETCTGPYFDMNKNSGLKGSLTVNEDGNTSMSMTIGSTNGNGECESDEDCTVGIGECFFGQCKECGSADKCNSGETCVWNWCMNEGDLIRLDTCVDEEKREGNKFIFTNNCASIECENCLDGYYSCPSFSNAEDFKKCIECSDYKDCKEGFICHKFRCILPEDKDKTEDIMCNSWSCSAGTDIRVCWSKVRGRYVEERPCESSSECIDSDGGKDYFTKGSTEGPDWFGNKFYEAEDVCGEYNWNSNILEEHYCENGFLYVEEYDCTKGCEDGRCLK